MKTYMVGYDLNKPGQDYSELIKAIEAYGTWWHHLDSTWIIKSDLSATAILNDLKLHVDKSDELLVARLQGDWNSVGFNQKGVDWLDRNMTYD